MDEQQKRIAWKLTPEAEDMLMTVFSTEAGRDDAVLLALRDLEDYYNAGERNETLPEIIKQLYDYEMKWVEVDFSHYFRWLFANFRECSLIS